MRPQGAWRFAPCLTPPPHHPANTHSPVTGNGPPALRSLDPDARWLFTFLISQLHYSLLTVISGRRPGVMSVLTPQMTPYLPPSFPPPFSHQPGPLCHCLTVFFHWSCCNSSLQIISMCRVPSAARREKIQITKCKCSTILLGCTVSLPAPDSLPLHARRFNETDPRPQPPSSFLWQKQEGGK